MHVQTLCRPCNQLSSHLLCHTSCILLALEQLVGELLPVVVARATPYQAKQGHSQRSSPVQWGIRHQLLSGDVTQSSKRARGDSLYGIQTVWQAHETSFVMYCNASSPWSLEALARAGANSEPRPLAPRLPYRTDLAISQERPAKRDKRALFTADRRSITSKKRTGCKGFARTSHKVSAMSPIVSPAT